MASPSPTSPRTTQLRSRAHAFCTAFTSATPPTEMLDIFFTPSPTITEHGPAWAQSRLPFLGKTFVGRGHPHRHQQKTQAQTTATATTIPEPPPESESQPEDEEDDDSSSTCDAYFAFLSQTLTFHPTEHTFPPAADIVVDAEAEGGSGVVSVVGRAEFRSVRTGKGWVEEFIWRLGGWDQEGRVGRWEIWADPSSAWVAVVGEGEGDGDGDGGKGA